MKCLFPFFALLLILTSCQQRYELAFVSDRSGHADIYLTDTDTSYFARLYTDDMIKHSPAWAPDGSAILFVAQGRWANDLAMVAPDGSNFRYITRDPYLVAHPGFSPDGKLIIYLSNRDHTNGEVYIMNPEGTFLKRLTFNFTTEITPHFAPNGRQVIYSEHQITSPDIGYSVSGSIYAIDTAGLPRSLLYLNETLPEMASFSPDGKKILFHEVIDDIAEIVLLDRPADARYRLTARDPDSRWPVWSPDGKWIAYVRRENDNSDIWIMRPDGSQKRPVVVSPFRDEMPAFRPRRK